MNLGQTLLSAAALVLLTVMVINANRLIVQSGKDFMLAEATDVGTGLAESLIQEIETKKFDMSDDGSGTQSLYYFNDPGYMGPSTYEMSYVVLPDTSWTGRFKSIRFCNACNQGYDDVDDYNGYIRIVDTDGVKGFQINVTVYYVKDAKPDVPSSMKTYFKRADIQVTNPYLSAAMNFSTIVPYGLWTGSYGP